MTTTSTAFSVTVSRNDSFGQYYVERSDMPHANIRIPSSRVSVYAEHGGLEEDDISALEQGHRIIADGEWAIALWQLAEAYEG